VKLIGTGVLAIAFAAGSFAQQAVPRHQALPTTTAPSHIATPATGFPPSITNPAFAQSLGTTVAGQGGTGYARHRYRQPVVAVPYAYPVYVGGYGDYGYGNDNSPTAGPAQQPQVIINQNFAPERATPVIREYGDDTSSSGVRVYDAPGREPVESAQDDVDYYLIAFKDHTIFSAFAYWVEADTLHYVTAQRAHNQASLSLVDRELTARLNRNHNMQVKLPN
jgi:hypothetical protein